MTVGIVLLVLGADRFVVGAGATARNLGVTPIMIGLTVVAFSTSAPEIFVSIVAASQGNTELAIGNALGSNIANIGLVLGATALVRPLVVRSDTVRREIPVLLAVTLFTLTLFHDQTLSRLDGVILMAGLVLVMSWIVGLGIRSPASDPILQEFEAEIRSDLNMAQATTWLGVGLAIMLVGSIILVSGAHEVAVGLGVSDMIIGLTMVAIGTSLPELAVSIVSAIRGEYDLAIGNIIGSNIFNLLAVLGIAGIIHETSVIREVLLLHFPVMIGFTLALFAMTYNFTGSERINRLEGVALLTAFSGYHWFLYLQHQAGG
ncbi:MAG: calcium/sodium antiporter [Gammaproteobacteria bacterium]